jgi:hypothetical protein
MHPVHCLLEWEASLARWLTPRSSLYSVFCHAGFFQLADNKPRVRVTSSFALWLASTPFERHGVAKPYIPPFKGTPTVTLS